LTSEEIFESLFFVLPIIITALISHLTMFLRHRSLFIRIIQGKPESLGNYDWKKIMEGKTNHELSEIYLGKTHLPNAVSELAKLELEKRNIEIK